MSNSLYSTEWRIKPLIALNSIAFLLLISWLLPTTRLLWDRFDYFLFTLLNDPIETSEIWATIWAVGSVRLTDIAVGLVMLSFLLWGRLLFRGEQIRSAFIGFIVLLIMMLLVRVGFTEFSELVGWGRASPTMLLPESVRLSEIFPEWVALGLKDSSSQSFPGDHASVILLWALNLSLAAKGWRCAVIWALAVVFMLPRLVAGAHWGTDDFVGGLFISLMTFSWACCTPLLATVTGKLLNILAPIFNYLGRYQPFAWFEFFSPTSVK